MLQEFKEFAAKGNVLDMAVGVIMGASFGKIVSTFTDGIMMPPVGKLMGNMDFSSWIINLSDKDVKTLEEAKKAGAAVMTPGLLINNLLDFVIVAFVLFLLVKQVNRLKAEPAPAPAAPPPPSKEQMLLAEIRDLLATRK
ncbi:MAG: large-conductance mechanosensitive channel protein MscL [Bryobacterales bacterium]|nr:large-conductance mechanosensitive channel protein MscL [Bryobacterales bacterium]